MVLAEQQEKERRNKAYKRWKIGGALFLAAFLLWFALSIMGNLRH